MWNWRFFFLSRHSFASAFWKQIGPGAAESFAWFKLATPKSTMPGYKRPSFYLLGSSLLLCVGTILSLRGDPLDEVSELTELRQKGWTLSEGNLPSCIGHGFFELESEQHSFEAYRDALSGTAMTSTLPIPGETYDCRPIQNPSFIQEIL